MKMLGKRIAVFSSQQPNVLQNVQITTAYSVIPATEVTNCPWTIILLIILKLNLTKDEQS